MQTEKKMPQIIRDLFEEEFKKVFGVRDAIAVNSGTSALIATLCSLDLKPTDEVITTPFTFAATTAAILIAGGKPVFVDIDPTWHLINSNLIEDAVTENTRAILPVHLFGRPCNMAKIIEIAKNHNLFVIEDNAQSFGVKYWDQYLGTIGDAGCFSFYKTKNFSTFEGGMVAIKANSKLNGTKIRKIASPTANKPAFQELGFNFRMPEPCALIGLEKIKMHLQASQAEIGSYHEARGFYPYVTYQLPFFQKTGIEYATCSVAEQVANEISTTGQT
jgi:dTDP-4-amino-4,6-dideoxygalactose transaminase